MARIVLQYKQDKNGQTTPNKESPGLAPFGSFCLSPRIQKLTIRIGKDVAALAGTLVEHKGERGKDKPYASSFKVVPDEIVVIDGLPRVTAAVVNTSDHSAALEFGSGEPSVGDSEGEGRPQGGYNEAQRPLGRAGAIIGEFHGG